MISDRAASERVTLCTESSGDPPFNRVVSTICFRTATMPMRAISTPRRHVDAGNLCAIMAKVRRQVYNLAPNRTCVSPSTSPNTRLTSMLSVWSVFWMPFACVDWKRNAAYQASTSELYRLVQEVLKRDNAFLSAQPAVAKRCFIVKNYAKRNMYLSNGIFQPRSPRRGPTFVIKDYPWLQNSFRFARDNLSWKP